MQQTFYLLGIQRLLFRHTLSPFVVSIFVEVSPPLTGSRNPPSYSSY
jgi:hypothetical protein